MACADLACVLLAAGEGARFGGNKLEAMLDGRMLGLHAAATLAGLGFGRRIAVCRADTPALNAAFKDAGFDVVVNPVAGHGLSASLKLGVEAVMPCEATGLLLALADMPFVTAAHLDALRAAFDGAGRTRAVASAASDVPMPPAIFPRAAWPALLAMEGDRGARALLGDAIRVAGEPSMLADIDTPGDLARSG
jgi:molybdenum cofactor cytidylyltransferase